MCEVNEWLANNSEKIAIIDRKFNTDIARSDHLETTLFSIAIFYTDKH